MLEDTLPDKVRVGPRSHSSTPRSENFPANADSPQRSHATNAYASAIRLMQICGEEEKRKWELLGEMCCGEVFIVELAVCG